MRFSSPDGMWGRANYFAVNTSYSNSYSHPLAETGEKQMFQATVIVGNTTVLKSDKSLTMPPLIPGTNQRYDSVQGHTGGSDVIMIYSNKKAYPQYLITYK